MTSRDDGSTQHPFDPVLLVAVVKRPVPLRLGSEIAVRIRHFPAIPRGRFLDRRAGPRHVLGRQVMRVSRAGGNCRCRPRVGGGKARPTMRPKHHMRGRGTALPKPPSRCRRQGLDRRSLDRRRQSLPRRNGWSGTGRRRRGVQRPCGPWTASSQPGELRRLGPGRRRCQGHHQPDPTKAHAPRKAAGGPSGPPLPTPQASPHGISPSQANPDHPAKPKPNLAKPKPSLAEKNSSLAKQNPSFAEKTKRFYALGKIGKRRTATAARSGGKAKNRTGARVGLSPTITLLRRVRLRVPSLTVVATVGTSGRPIGRSRQNPFVRTAESSR